MEVVKTLRSGKPCAKHLLKGFGNNLAALRFWLERKNYPHYTTVEILVEQKCAPFKATSAPSDTLVARRVFLHESPLQRQFKAAGGHWDREKQDWLLAQREAERLGLTDRNIRQ